MSRCTAGGNVVDGEGAGGWSGFGITRASTRWRIAEAQRIVARDQNKVFVEKANRRRLAPKDAEAKYGLEQGKANAYVEFDVEVAELFEQYNDQLQIEEHYLAGDVDLTQRNAEAFFNFGGK